jgi:hypothetical protein
MMKSSHIQYGGLYAQSNIPSKIMVPTQLDNRLNFAVSNPTRINLNREDKKQAHVSSFDPTYFTTSKVSTTTVQPPMIWFPGSSDCTKQENKDAGKEVSIIVLIYIPLKCL